MSALAQAAQEYLLVPAVRDRLRETAPEAGTVVVTDPPVLGAALAGLDALGAAEHAKQRLAGEVRRRRSLCPSDRGP